jgi:hypothetical protein
MAGLSSFGVVYCATTARHLEEACQSAASVRKLMPGLPCALFVSADLEERARVEFEHLFTLANPSRNFDDKIEAARNSPFEKSLFLDSDTIMIEPVWEIADLLDRFDFAYTHDIHRGLCYEPECPESFTEPCSAVLAWRRTPHVEAILRHWRERYDDENRRRAEHPLMCYNDQGSLRHVLYVHGHQVDTYVLPPEYNLRVYAPWFAGGVAKILHARGKYLRRAIRTNVNRDIVIRTGDGMKFIERWIFSTKRWIKNRLLRRPAEYDYRLKGLSIDKPASQPDMTGADRD